MEMLRKASFLLLVILAFVLSLSNRVICQNKVETAQANGGSGTSEPIWKATTRDSNPRRNPILLVPAKAGPPLWAYLIGSDSEDLDAIVVEIKGERRSVKLDDVTIIQQARKFDEFGDIALNDMKHRLDNYAIELQTAPGDSAYVLAYGSCLDQARSRVVQLTDYMANIRGIDARRIVSVDGGCRRNLTIELWLVPSGTAPPTGSTEGVVSPCPRCVIPKPKPKPKKPVKRRRS